MRKFLPFLVFSILLMSSPALALAASSTAKTMAGQSHPAVSDAQLEATIRTKLAKSKIGKDGFRFHVQRGVVTWEGKPPWASTKAPLPGWPAPRGRSR